MGKRSDRRKKNKRRRLRKIKIIISIIIPILLISFIGWYEVYISYNNLTIKTYNIDSDKVNLDKDAESSDNSPIKFIVISDLHDNTFGDNNKRLIEIIEQQDPNFIIADGDMLNDDSTNTELVETIIKKLVKIAPVYYALGNHEYEYMANDSEFIEKINNTGASVVEESFRDIVVKNTNIRIGGMYDYAAGTFEQNSSLGNTGNFLSSFENTPSYKIMMSHRPDSFIFGTASKDWHIDLVVSGHNHGGQVVLPFVGGLYGGDQGFFPEYIHGLYKKDNINLLVTNGLGSSSQKIPRFNNVPEVVVVNLY